MQKQDKQEADFEAFFVASVNADRMHKKLKV